jgi:hypothetical protein
MPGDANAPADCAHEKDPQMQAFSKRLKGFEPSTFCMASSRSAQENHGEMPANRRISASLMPGRGVQQLRRIIRGLDKEQTMRSSWDRANKAG